MTAALDLHPEPGHPGAVVAGVHALLDEVGVVDLPAGEYGVVVAECDRAVRRLAALKLKLVAAADKASAPTMTGSRNTATWLATQTRADQAASARDTRLALDLDDKLPTTASAFADGDFSAEHARVIAEAMRQLPAGLTRDQRTQVETRLTADARRVDPRTLRRCAKRALAVVEPDETVVNAHENTLVADEETRALARARLTLHDNIDGTTTGHFTVPTLAASMLAKVLNAMTSPRRGRTGATKAQAGMGWADRDPAHERGLAFVQILEHLPTDHLHSKTAATLVVTLDEDALRDKLKAAGCDTADLASAGTVRRLACGAGILPAVFGGTSAPLDCGFTRRFFTETHRTVGATLHTTCAADGCQTPYAWCELHHKVPWSKGGKTNLDQMVPLCGFHHRRIHDPAYDHRHHGDRSVTFHRRT